MVNKAVKKNPLPPGFPESLNPPPKRISRFLSVVGVWIFSETTQCLLCLFALNLGERKANEASRQGQQMVFQRVVQQLAIGENIHTSLLCPLINIVRHLTPICEFQCSFIQIYLSITLLDVDALGFSSDLGITTNFDGEHLKTQM